MLLPACSPNANAFVIPFLLLTIHIGPAFVNAAPLSGAWRLNLSKSSGVNPETYVFETKTGFLTYSDTKNTYAFELSGKEFPVGSAYEGISASWLATERLHFEHVLRKNGRIQKIVRLTIRPDGQSIHWKQGSMGREGEISASEAELERIDGSFDPANPLSGKWRVVPILRLAETSFGLRLHSLEMSFEGKFDAREYPLEGSSQYDAVRLAMIDRAAALEVSYVKNGQVKVITEYRVSEDGKTLTIAEVGGDSETRATAVFEKLR